MKGLISIMGFILTAAIQVSQADYRLDVTRRASDSLDVYTGTRLYLRLSLSSDAQDQHNAGIFRVEFSRPGLEFEQYQWASPFEGGVISDDSKPSYHQLPLVLNENTLVGVGYSPGVVDIELSNVTGGSSRFKSGPLVDLSFRIPSDFPVGDLTVTPVIEGFSDGFNLVTASSGPALRLNVLPKPADYNTPPFFSPLSNQTTLEETTLGGLTFSVDDDEELPDQIQVTVSSSNPSIVGPSGLQISGDGKFRTLNITPQSDGFGETTITLTAFDGRTAGTTQFVLNVVNINDPPVLSVIDDFVFDEDAGVLNIPFSVFDSDNIPDGLIISARSNNALLFPASALSVVGIGTDRSINLIPQPDAYGVATITVTVSDGLSSVVESFLVEVVNINDPPALGIIENQTMLEDGWLVVPLVLSDTDHELFQLKVTAGSDNEDLLPSANITYSPNPFPRLELRPLPDKSGIAEILVEVSDGQLSSVAAFGLSVEPVNDVPQLGGIPDQVMRADEILSFNFDVEDVDNLLTDLKITATSRHPNIVSDAGLKAGIAGGFGFLSITPNRETLSGVARIAVQAEDPSGATSTLEFDLQVEAVPVAIGSSELFKRWQQENNLPDELSKPEDDADGDLVPNIVEFVFGSNPTSRTNEGLPKPIIIRDSQRNPSPALTFIRNNQIKGASVEIVASSSLDKLTPIELVEETQDLGNGLSRVVLRPRASSVKVSAVFFITRVRID